MLYTSHYASPLGGMTLVSDGTALVGLYFDGQKYAAEGLDATRTQKNLLIFEEARRWLDVYFSGRKPDFTPPTAPAGTAFQQSVWEILRTIPYGQTVTYGAIARRIEQNTGCRMSAQAVGGAVGRNPISILIPCHRVVGTNGSLTGYAGGIDKKERLLRWERAR
ncbi:6-O-methylguanine DNA methyltransferase, DNA binding domain protein [Selenomonas noxia ATCC 43541]|uniref:methylated-DNA--[protein]-cysteine S-methyltransferase n=1 Tax=Selenomonas noxia TaxID=135083 RepID=UPI0001BCCD9D|nr:methylated-DNA--[protein]-cysteine S-methyltransferase [Selenomonas noxia]EFF67192.1 6-O-methylguanine DNA methyltransferase, DNA binding domain protein [Selenomonas noxia ATCC 43541]